MLKEFLSTEAKRKAEGILVNLLPGAKREAEGFLVNLPPRAEQEAKKWDLDELFPRAKREAEGIFVNHLFKPVIVGFRPIKTNIKHF